MHRVPHRIAATLMVAAITLSGCLPNSGKNPIDDQKIMVVNPFLMGLGATERDQYTTWWKKVSDPAAGRTFINAFTGKQANPKMVDPNCPLHYAYQTNSGNKIGRSGSSGLGSGSDGLELSDTRAQGQIRNGALEEALIWVVGTELTEGDTRVVTNGGEGKPGTTAVVLDNSGQNCVGPDEKSAGTGGTTRNPIYIPVRLNLGVKPHLIVEGFAGAAAAVSITADFGPAHTAKIVGNFAFTDGETRIYSSGRLRRFVIDDYNGGRVLDYAKLDRNSSGDTPRIFWFRLNEFAPFYRAQAPLDKPQCAVFAAAWKKDSDGAKACGIGIDIADAGSPNYTWLDPAGRPTDTWNNAGRVGSCQLGQDLVQQLGACGNNLPGIGTFHDLQNNFGKWPGVEEALRKFNMSATNGSDKAVDQGRIDEYQALLAKLETDAGANKPPAELMVTVNGQEVPAKNVVGILANNGSGGYVDSNGFWTQKLPMGSAWSATAPGFQLFGSNEVSSVSSKTMTVTPRVGTVINDEAKYKSVSYLFGDKQPASINADFSTTDFDTAGSADAKLDLYRAPLLRLKFNVKDPVHQGVGTDYVSDWMPILSLGDMWPPDAEQSACGQFDFLCWVNLILANIITGIYSFTIGFMVQGLASSATGAYLTIPSIEQFVVDRMVGSTIFYQLKEDVLTRNTAAATGDQKLQNCLNTTIDRTKPSANPYCFEQNGIWWGFSFSRAMMAVLLLFYLARFLIFLQLRRDTGLTINAFLARLGIAAAWVAFFPQIMALLGAVVAEVIVITNGIGTNITGHPYNHLWLFLKYANPPVTTDWLQALGLLIGGCVAFLGLLVMVIVTWARLILFTFVLIVSPIWMADLMRNRRPSTFYRGIILFLKLYLVPILTLVVLLFGFILNGWIANSVPGGGIISAFLFVALAIGASVIPLVLSWKLVANFQEAIKTQIENAMMSGESAKFDQMVRSGLAGESVAAAGAGASGGSWDQKTLADRGLGAGGRVMDDLLGKKASQLSRDNLNEDITRGGKMTLLGALQAKPGTTGYCRLCGKPISKPKTPRKPKNGEQAKPVQQTTIYEDLCAKCRKNPPDGNGGGGRGGNGGGGGGGTTAPPDGSTATSASEGTGRRRRRRGRSGGGPTSGGPTSGAASASPTGSATSILTRATSASEVTGGFRSKAMRMTGRAIRGTGKAAVNKAWAGTKMGGRAVAGLTGYMVATGVGTVFGERIGYAAGRMTTMGLIKGGGLATQGGLRLAKNAPGAIVRGIKSAPGATVDAARKTAAAAKQARESVLATAARARREARRAKTRVRATVRGVGKAIDSIPDQIAKAKEAAGDKWDQAIEASLGKNFAEYARLEEALKNPDLGPEERLSLEAQLEEARIAIVKEQGNAGSYKHMTYRFAANRSKRRQSEREDAYQVELALLNALEGRLASASEADRPALLAQIEAQRAKVTAASEAAANARRSEAIRQAAYADPEAAADERNSLLEAEALARFEASKAKLDTEIAGVDGEIGARTSELDALEVRAKALEDQIALQREAAETLSGGARSKADGAIRDLDERLTKLRENRKYLEQDRTSLTEKRTKLAEARSRLRRPTVSDRGETAAVEAAERAEVIAKAPFAGAAAAGGSSSSSAGPNVRTEPGGQRTGRRGGDKRRTSSADRSGGPKSSTGAPQPNGSGGTNGTGGTPPRPDGTGNAPRPNGTGGTPPRPNGTGGTPRPNGTGGTPDAPPISPLAGSILSANSRIAALQRKLYIGTVGSGAGRMRMMNPDLDPEEAVRLTEELRALDGMLDRLLEQAAVGGDMAAILTATDVADQALAQADAQMRAAFEAYRELGGDVLRRPDGSEIYYGDENDPEVVRRRDAWLAARERRGDLSGAGELRERTTRIFEKVANPAAAPTSAVPPVPDGTPGRRRLELEPLILPDGLGLGTSPFVRFDVAAPASSRASRLSHARDVIGGRLWTNWGAAPSLLKEDTTLTAEERKYLHETMDKLTGQLVETAQVEPDATETFLIRKESQAAREELALLESALDRAQAANDPVAVVAARAALTDFRNSPAFHQLDAADAAANLARAQTEAAEGPRVEEEIARELKRTDLVLERDAADLSKAHDPRIAQARDRWLAGTSAYVIRPSAVDPGQSRTDASRGEQRAADRFDVIMPADSDRSPIGDLMDELDRSKRTEAQLAKLSPAERDAHLRQRAGLLDRLEALAKEAPSGSEAREDAMALKHLAAVAEVTKEAEKILAEAKAKRGTSATAPAEVAAELERAEEATALVRRFEERETSMWRARRQARGRAPEVIAQERERLAKLRGAQPAAPTPPKSPEPGPAKTGRGGTYMSPEELLLTQSQVGTVVNQIESAPLDERIVLAMPANEARALLAERKRQLEALSLALDDSIALDDPTDERNSALAEKVFGTLEEQIREAQTYWTDPNADPAKLEALKDAAYARRTVGEQWGPYLKVRERGEEMRKSERRRVNELLEEVERQERRSDRKP